MMNKPLWGWIVVIVIVLVVLSVDYEPEPPTVEIQRSQPDMAVCHEG